MSERAAQHQGLGLLVAVAIVALNSAYVSAYTGFVHGPEIVSETDHLRYIEMAKRAADAGFGDIAFEPPYSYRILTPNLVAALIRLGVDLDVAYYALTSVCLVGFLFALYSLLATYGLDVRERVLALVLVGLTQGAVRWYAYQYWMSDPLALFLITLALLWVRTEKLAALFALSIVAVAARESYLVVFPYLFLRTWRTHGPTVAFERTLAVSLAPLAMLFWIRTSSDAMLDADLLRKMRFYVGWRWKGLFENQLYICTIGTFGVLLPLALLYPRRLWNAARRNTESLVLVALVYASLLVGNNTDRLLAYALPVLLPVAMKSFSLWVASTRLPFAVGAGLAVASQAVLYRQTVFFDWHAASVSQPFNALAAGTIVAFWLAAIGALQFRANGGGVRPEG
jgi:hypothetical protein